MNRQPPPNTDFDESLLNPQGDDIVRPVYTMPLHEFRLRDYCLEHGISCYLPLRKVARVLKRTHGSTQYRYVKEVMRPMFSSYLFVKLAPDQRTSIFASESVRRILTVENPARFLEELRTVRRIEQIALTEPLDFNAGIKEGDHFLIESGPWEGITEWLRKKDKRALWTVEIECVNTLVQATIDPTLYKMRRVEE